MKEDIWQNPLIIFEELFRITKWNSVTRYDSAFGMISSDNFELFQKRR